MNLLNETLESLGVAGKGANDVVWVGSESFGWFSWDLFVLLADVEYDSGDGAAEVAEDLVVVGDGWWLERYEYDGSEEWHFKILPVKPSNECQPKRLTGGMWSNLESLQGKEDTL